MWGASAGRNRLPRSASTVAHAAGPATTLTACHGTWGTVLFFIDGIDLIFESVRRNRKDA